MKLSFFTKDPMIPYFATYYIFETNHILSNKKRKIIKENIADIINGCCTQLKYKIDTPAKLLKKIRWSFNYNIPEVKKRKLCSWVSNDKYHLDYFHPKKIIKQSK